MTDAPEVWAIVELMGHVKLAGKLTEEEKFGTKMGRLDIPAGEGCSGVSAGWCPIHGDCTCKNPDDKNDETCPLHSAASNHGERQGPQFVTQLFGGASVYRITIVTEAVARQVNRSTSPAPVSPWDFPKQLTNAELGHTEEAQCGDEDDDQYDVDSPAEPPF